MSGTEETWRFVRAIWKGEEFLWLGESMRVPSGVNSRAFLVTMLVSVSQELAIIKDKKMRREGKRRAVPSVGWR